MVEIIGGWEGATLDEVLNNCTVEASMVIYLPGYCEGVQVKTSSGLIIMIIPTEESRMFWR